MNKNKLCIGFCSVLFTGLLFQLSVKAQGCSSLNEYYFVTLIADRYKDISLMRLIPVTDSSRIAGRKIQYKNKNFYRFRDAKFKQVKSFFLDQNCKSVSFIYPTVYLSNVISSVDSRRLGTFRDFVDYNCQASISSNGVINGTCSFSQKLMIGSISFDAEDNGLLNAKPIRAEQVPKGVRDKLEI